MPSFVPIDDNLFPFYATVVVVVVSTLILLYVFLYRKRRPHNYKEKVRQAKDDPEPPKSMIVDTREGKAIHPDEWRSFTLVDKETISHDVRRFRFKFPDENLILGLPIGQHISLKFVDSAGKVVIRSYTPVTSDDEKGYVDFIIKVYFANVHPKFPEGGKMSQHMNNLNIGDPMMMKGPKGHLEYKGDGHLVISRKQKLINYEVRRLGLIAGGTGLTPMLQIIRAVLKNPDDKTELSLIFANQTAEDILLRSELDKLQASHSNLRIRYTVDRPDEDWPYSVGFVDAEMCRTYLPAAEPDTMILMCGPPPMIKFACEPALKELGFHEDQWYSF